ncbi:helix-turn-helix transcriptional regulator [Listeria marthii]|uniref:helix-turn-helix transcriptional regulator n=1 Tax=Listeria marthii TaxID=529731 RepID=UPI001886B6F5|nr:helix-turn-helix transcriptional regulator [Listeria marthii]MBF2392071.1 helix-turn-helix transcriptional regulator [Listeria marthii]
MALHLKLREERIRNNWTQDKLAEKVGVSREMIGRWERQKAIPTLSNCIRICKVFELTVDYLIKDNIDTKDNQIKYILLGKGILELVGEKYPVDFFRKYSIVSKEEILAIPRKQGLDFLEVVRTELDKAEIDQQNKKLRNYMRQFILSWHKFNKARCLLAKEQSTISMKIYSILFSQEELKQELEGLYSKQSVMLLRDLMIKRLEKYVCSEYRIKNIELLKGQYEFNNDLDIKNYQMND